MSSGITDPNNEDVYISVGSDLANGNASLISGWTRVRVTRGIERMPSDFEIEMTEYYSGDNTSVVVTPGDQCQVFLGEHLVLTGYVDSYISRIVGDRHSITIMGRSMSEDLVDCSAEYPNAQIMSASVLQIVQALAAPYKIKVTQNVVPDASRDTIPQTVFVYAETAVEVISRITRYAKVLFFDQPDGSIILTTASSKKAASGFTEGVNVQEAEATFTMNRFQTYSCQYNSTVMFGDGTQLNSGQNNTINQLGTPEIDSTVQRNRKKYIILESGDTDPFRVTLARALWEKNRRFGKAWEVRIVTDSWRDSAGNLWEPNTLVDIHLPTVKVPNSTWLINEVTFQRDERTGTTAILIINPAEAFIPEPIVLLPSAFPDRAIQDGNTAASTGTGSTSGTPSVAYPLAAPVYNSGNVDLVPDPALENKLPANQLLPFIGNIAIPDPTP